MITFRLSPGCNRDNWHLQPPHRMRMLRRALNDHHPIQPNRTRHPDQNSQKLKPKT